MDWLTIGEHALTLLLGGGGGVALWSLIGSLVSGRQQAKLALVGEDKTIREELWERLEKVETKAETLLATHIAFVDESNQKYNKLFEEWSTLKARYEALPCSQGLCENRRKDA